MITLIGMPGSGKSTLGRLLAGATGRAFVDTDPLIEARHGRPLGDVLAELGREAFLDLEADVVGDLPAGDMVCAPGGSVIYRERAMRHLAMLGPVAYLRVPLADLERRVGDLAARGVAGNEGGLAALFEERTPLYERYATVTVDASGDDPQATLGKLLTAV